VDPQQIGVCDDPAGTPRSLSFGSNETCSPTGVIRQGNFMNQKRQASDIRPQAEAKTRQSDAEPADEHLETSPGELAVRAFSGKPGAPVGHIDSTPHEQGSSGKVHCYRADYTVGEDSIMWMAEVEVDRTSRTFAGSVPLTSAGVVSLAEQAVRDAVVRAIDGLDSGTDH